MQIPTLAQHRSFHRGIVLPVVLVMLALVTTLVLFTLRRGSLDERLAANVRGIVTMETAAQYSLRYCELWVGAAPPGTPVGPTGLTPPQTVVPVAPAAGAVGVWHTAANWASAVTLPAAVIDPSLTSAQCLIEDASGELTTTSGAPSSPMTATNGWRKYRLTAEVQGPGLDGPANPLVARAQSEIRMFVN